MIYWPVLNDYSCLWPHVRPSERFPDLIETTRDPQVALGINPDRKKSSTHLISLVVKSSAVRRFARGGGEERPVPRDPCLQTGSKVFLYLAKNAYLHSPKVMPLWFMTGGNTRQFFNGHLPLVTPGF